jgi:alpha-L-arabinofuranosidase
MKTHSRLPCLFAASILAFSQALLAQQTLPVYTDNLVNGWQDWSWIPDNLANTSPVQSGSDSISANASDDNYQALSFQQPIFNSYQGGFNTTPYNDFVFWANGGSAGGQLLQVNANYDDGNDQGNSVALSALQANTWVQYTVPLSSILPAGVSNLYRINIQLLPGVTNTFYVDNIYFTAQSAPALQHLSVNASNTIRSADARWFGVNTAVWDGYLDTSYTSNALSAAGVLSLRFPGGSASDQYHWETGESIPWTDGVAGAPVNWSVNFSNFMHLATNAGAQAFITVNYGSGTSNEAAAWVRNANITNHCNFKYWEVGNEVYGNWEQDTNNPPNDPYIYATRFAGYYALMKAADPNIEVGAVSIAGEDSEDTYTNHPATNSVTGLVHNGWTPVMLARMKSLGVTPDFLIYHLYPESSPTETPEPADDCDPLVLQVSSQVAGDAANLRMMLTDYLGSSSANTELVCTENNSDSGAEGRQMTSLVNALYLADTDAQLMQTEFNAYTWWDLRNGPGNTGSFDPTLYGWRTQGDEGLVDGQNSYYPDYYAMSMMQYFVRPGDTVLKASSDYLLLSAYASLGANGSLRLLVLNKATNAVFKAQISLTNFSPSSSATVYTYGMQQDGATQSNLSLTLQQIAVSNFTSASKLFTNSFSPLSMTLYNFPPAPTIATTTVNLTSGANPSTYGNPVTFTATVLTNGVAVGGISGETVAFYNGAGEIGSGTLNTSGQAQYATTDTQLTAGTHSITAVYSGDSNYAASTNTPALSQSVNKATPSITWGNPAGITYGAALGSSQLDATANVPGGLAYTPTTGTVPNSGTNTLSVNFTPTDGVDYTTASAMVSLVVSTAPLTATASNASRVYGQANPTFTGSIVGLTNNDNITESFSCSANSSSKAGQYAIMPSLVDPDHRATNYAVNLVDGMLNVGQATPTITWTNPTAITYGAALSGVQLNAMANVPGNFAYTPTNGTVLNSGTNMLSASFMPTDVEDYTSANAMVSMVISPALLNVTTANASRAYDQANPVFTGEITGVTNGDNITVSYSCSATTNSPVGQYPIMPSLVDPENRQTNYMVSLMGGLLTIGQATPVLMWTNPAPIIYGTALSSNQLDATASVPGLLAYNPTNGTVPNSGANTLSVIFTPTDGVDYTSAGAMVGLVVSPASLTATAASASRAYAQVNPVFTGEITGVTNGDDITALYSCSATTNSPVGQSFIMPTLVDPEDRETNYTVNLVDGILTIGQATPILMWTNPASITYGAALGSNQLDAAANVPGILAYNPTNGTVLNTGTNTLSVIFTPSDAVDYTGAGAMVGLVVSPASLMATASDASRAYAQMNPVFTGEITGVTNGDNITVFYSCIATTNSAVGQYSIMPSLLDPEDRQTNYTVNLADGILTIGQAAPILTWTYPAPIIYGTALGSNQLDATANVPGILIYSPSAGTILSPGTNMLGVLFNPADALDYSTATDSVSLVVSLVPILLNLQLDHSNVVLSWNDPASVFALQAALALTNEFTNVPGAASPYTNAATAAQQFFKLSAPSD